MTITVCLGFLTVLLFSCYHEPKQRGKINCACLGKKRGKLTCRSSKNNYFMWSNILFFSIKTNKNSCLKFKY